MITKSILFISLPMRFGWNPVSYHRKVVMNRLRPVVEKRLLERKKLGDDYKPYVRKIAFLKIIYLFFYINLNP